MRVSRFNTVFAIALASAMAFSSCTTPPPAAPPAPFDVVEASIPEMQTAMREGRTTSRQIVTQYLTRIGLYEDGLNVAVAINPNALAQADALDRERAAGRVRGPLHGIPVAVKDNVLTKDDLPTTGGMLAFRRYQAPYDATLVTKLENAGAIILAKSTMSELAGWFGDSFRPGGYNAAVGQSYNPYDPRANDDGTPVLEVSGSSSGRRRGRQPVGSQRRHQHRRLDRGTGQRHHARGHPASTGRISRYGIIPLSLDQDTAGPMTKSVADAAIMLGVMEGEPDANDTRTTECAAPPNHDYTPFLKADALKGARIGIPRAGIYEARQFPGQARPFPGSEARRAGVDGGGHCRAEDRRRRRRRSRRPAEHDATEPANNLTSHNICEAPFTGKAGRRPVLDRASLRHEARLQPVAGDARRLGAGQDPRGLAGLERSHTRTKGRCAMARDGSTTPTRPISRKTRPASSAIAGRI